MLAEYCHAFSIHFQVYQLIVVSKIVRARAWGILVSVSSFSLSLFINIIIIVIIIITHFSIRISLPLASMILIHNLRCNIQIYIIFLYHSTHLVLPLLIHILQISYPTPIPTTSILRIFIRINFLRRKNLRLYRRRIRLYKCTGLVVRLLGLLDCWFYGEEGWWGWLFGVGVVFVESVDVFVGVIEV